jgi:hypothetical protein
MPDDPTPRCQHGWPRNHPSPCTACAAEAAFDAGFDLMLARMRSERRDKIKEEIAALDEQIGSESPWQI